MPVLPALNYDHYFNFKEITSYLQRAQEVAPHLVKLYSMGQSFEGRPLLIVEMTNFNSGEASDKPALWVDGNIHSAEMLGSMAILELVRRMVGSHGRDELVTDLLDHTTFYLAPSLSPDGLEFCLSTGSWVASSMRDYPSAESRHPGFAFGDVDGDGRVRQMRIADPLGEWKASKRDPRLLVPRRPDDRQGEFYRLYREGRLTKGSKLDEITLTGLSSSIDFDQNFSCYWSEEASGQVCPGPFSLSEPETRAIADFFRSRSNIFAALSLHTFGELLYGPSHLSQEDQKLFSIVGERLEQVSGSSWISAESDQMSKGGSFCDWLYENYGILSFRLQMWSCARAAGIEFEDPQSFVKQDRGEIQSSMLLKWADKNLPSGEAFAPWEKFSHPELGEVEIGGWDLLRTWFNPPAGKFLKEEVHKAYKAILMLALCAPRLGVKQMKDEVIGQSKEGASLRKVELTIENSGFLPTWGTQRGLSLPHREKMHVEASTSGSDRLEIGSSHLWEQGLTGRVSAHLDHQDSAWFLGVSSTQRQHFQWMVAGSQSLKVTVEHGKAGRLEESSVLNEEASSGSQRVEQVVATEGPSSGGGIPMIPSIHEVQRTPSELVSRESAETVAPATPTPSPSVASSPVATAPEPVSTPPTPQVGLAPPSAPSKKGKVLGGPPPKKEEFAPFSLLGSSMEAHAPESLAPPPSLGSSEPQAAFPSASGKTDAFSSGAAPSAAASSVPAQDAFFQPLQTLSGASSTRGSSEKSGAERQGGQAFGGPENPLLAGQRREQDPSGSAALDFLNDNPPADPLMTTQESAENQPRMVSLGEQRPGLAEEPSAARSGEPSEESGVRLPAPLLLRRKRGSQES